MVSVETTTRPRAPRSNQQQAVRRRGAPGQAYNPEGRASQPFESTSESGKPGRECELSDSLTARALGTASYRQTGWRSTWGHSLDSSKLEPLLPASVVCSRSRTRSLPANWQRRRSNRAGSSATGEPAIESTAHRQRAVVGRKSASQRSGMSESCPQPLPAGWQWWELEAATGQGEPSQRRPRTVDDCVATASAPWASKLARAASARAPPRHPASWGSRVASTAACPSSEGLRNTHPAIRYSTPRPARCRQVGNLELLGFAPHRQAAAEPSRECRARHQTRHVVQQAGVHTQSSRVPPGTRRTGSRAFVPMASGSPFRRSEYLVRGLESLGTN